MVLGFGKSDSATVGCYGKLPSQGDYISHQAAGAEARRLTSWLDSGYRLEGAKDDVEGESTRFILRPRGRRTIAGTVWPSADASGTRRFPFAMFLEMRVRQLSPLGSALPLGLAPLWREMALTIPEARAATTLDGISGCLGKMVIPGVPDREQVTTSFREQASVPENAWAGTAVLLDLHRLIGALGGRKEAPAFAVWMPLRTRYSAEIESTAWLSVLERGLGPGFLGGCSLFVRAARAGEPGALFVIHRDMKDEDLRYLLTPSEDYPYANNLGGEAEDEELREFEEVLRDRLGSSPSLLELIEFTPGG